MTSNISLLQIQTPTQIGTCKDIVPQEQAGHIERSVTNRSTDKPKRDTPDKPSHLWPLGSVQCMNDGQNTSLAKSLEYKYTRRREANDISYAYRPTPIDFGPQHPIPLSTSLFPSHTTSPSPFHTTSPPLVSNRNTHPFQALEPIEEDEMPDDAARKFIMSPLAPPFVPRQEGQVIQRGQLGQGGQPSQRGQQGILSLSLEH